MYSYPAMFTHVLVPCHVHTCTRALPCSHMYSYTHMTRPPPDSRYRSHIHTCTCAPDQQRHFGVSREHQACDAGMATPSRHCIPTARTYDMATHGWHAGARPDVAGIQEQGLLEAWMEVYGEVRAPGMCFRAPGMRSGAPEVYSVVRTQDCRSNSA